MKPFSYNKIISSENLFSAWNIFKKGKRKRYDVLNFERNLEENIFQLHKSLANKTYRHDRYSSFFVNDPKRRHIHKASVKDRLVHQVLYDYLYRLFDKTFIYDSYSCRVGKGTHKGIRRLEQFCRRVSNNYSNECWALKLDIKKFFASIDHEILLELIKSKVRDEDILWLTANIICSFEEKNRKGIPLGNLTSQIFANIYLNKLDYFVKHILKEKHYIRYADDFVIVLKGKHVVNSLTNQLIYILQNELKLIIHPNKIILRKLEWGIDFLGYVILPNHILPRTSTKRRMLGNIDVQICLFYKGLLDKYKLSQTFQSYFGFLSHANSYNLKNRICSKLPILQDAN